MGRREQQIEHLLRRAGFGGSPNEIDFYSRNRRPRHDRPPDLLRPDPGRRRQPDRPARLRQRDHPRHLRAAPEHHRRAPALAVPDGPLRAPAPGEDGALLAQPLRDRLHQDRRRLRRHRGDADAGGQAVRGSRRHQGAARAVPRARARQLPRPADRRRRRIRRCWCGWTAATTSRTRPQENYAREIMELFTFGVANVVEDDVKAAARVFTGWNLQPGSARAAPTTTATSSAPTGTTTRSRTSPSRSTRTAAAPSPPTASRKAST